MHAASDTEPVTDHRQNTQSTSDRLVMHAASEHELVTNLCILWQAKAMQQGGEAKAGPAATNNAEALSNANFGPKYEAHVQEMQNKLDEASKR